jgi:hypothetical protein
VSRRQNPEWPSRQNVPPIEMAQTSDLETIVKRTGRKPEAVLDMAKRLGLSINGKVETRATRRRAMSARNFQ